ncbi:hypothetical protein NT2_05_02140 [Caenibius tardaugens NBRC 16725]|uniref:Lipoprotein n=1 Tax=Caenibius tardaugens NBRC 16725 TaxID=1219035 RepID=U2ZV97_9SPHN|nr:hypothetical protein [Caenibius tardaugens]GAD49294.1 hypothetical protein NT2_05_02140 [Caenibius tardaugens NBRC 16725]
MKKFALVAAAAVAALGVAACSEQTKDNAAATADAAGQDVKNAAAATGEAVDNAATAAATAADKAVAATDELGAKVGQKAAEVEASAHNESVAEAKRD